MCNYDEIWYPHYLIWKAGFITSIVGAVLMLIAAVTAPCAVEMTDTNGWVDGSMADVKPLSVTITGQRTETRTRSDKNGTHTYHVTVTGAFGAVLAFRKSATQPLPLCHPIDPRCRDPSTVRGSSG